MAYKHIAEQGYIFTSYWGNADPGDRLINTKDLIALSEERESLKFVIDIVDYNSKMEPLDFFYFAMYFLNRKLANQIKIAIVSAPSNQRIFQTKYGLNNLGILSEIFHHTETAIQWLLSVNDREDS